MKILVTGGCGYIGSHITIELIQSGYEVYLFDNLVNSSRNSYKNIINLAGKEIPLYVGDIRDFFRIKEVLSETNVDAVVHLAGLKSVSESILKPFEYFDVNVNGTLQLVKAMSDKDIKKLIFSSSATVYGTQAKMPCLETFKRGCTTNPYGKTKSQAEDLLESFFFSMSDWSITILRYFNPVGAHRSGIIGEDPKNIPSNLMPIIVNAASELSEPVKIFGDDYDTPDGTCLRDYIHVVDLAEGHVAALDSMQDKNYEIFNLGTGNPISVLEMIKEFSKVNGVKVAHYIDERREGDLACVYADPTKAISKLNWTPKRSLSEMVEDAWRFHNSK